MEAEAAAEKFEHYYSIMQTCLLSHAGPDLKQS